MTNTPEIFEVVTLNNGRWTIQSRCRTEEQAIAEAREFFDRRQCTGVKVVKEAFDEQANLYREFTIFRLPSSNSGVLHRPAAKPTQGNSANGAKPGDSAPKRRGLLEILTHRS